MAPVAHLLTSRALGWLRRFQELGALPPDTTAELADPDRTYKPLGETALAASLVLREGVAGPVEVTHATELLAFVWAQLREGDLLYERQLRYPMMTDPLELYAHFAGAGYRHRRLEELLTHLLKLRLMEKLEFVPARRLAVANAARIAGLDGPVDWDALGAATWLGGTPEPWAIDWPNAYAMTHTVFHLTDWGARPEYLPEPMRDYLSRWLPAWLEVWVEVEDWDLVTELLIVDACLAQPVCPARAWERLVSVQHPDGLVPRDGTPVSPDHTVAYPAHHHTTMVATIAGTLALSRGLSTVAAGEASGPRVSYSSGPVV